jgi:hypothetical protein
MSPLGRTRLPAVRSKKTFFLQEQEKHTEADGYTQFYPELLVKNQLVAGN